MGTQDYIQTRIEELGELDDGWDGDGSRAPSPAMLAWVERVFTSAYPRDLPTPRLDVCFDGDIMAEWEINGWEVLLAREGGGDMLYTLHGWHERSGSDLSITATSLDSPDGWALIAHVMRWMVEARA